MIESGQVEYSPIPQLNLLVVEDVPEDVELILLTLETAGISCRHDVASNRVACEQLLQQQNYDIVLSDYRLPDLNGLQAFKLLQQSNQEIPFILITGSLGEESAVECIKAGMTDYVLKDRLFRLPMVLQRALQEFDLKRQQKIAIAKIQTELAERRRIEAQLRHDAFHDALTGLPNRALFIDRLQHALQLSHRRSQRNQGESAYHFAVLFLDLDRFKVVNDSLGHMVGDRLLKAVAERLRSSLRMGDTVARLGGDEFVVLLEDIADINDAIEAVQRIHQELQGSVFLDGHEIFVSASIGIAFNSANYTQPDELLRDADIAMYRAKGQGRGGYQVFDTSMHVQALRQLKLENDLRRAIERREFCLQYQPIFSLRSKELQGVEALVRWQHPEHGLIPPSEFISIAEDTDLIMEIDLWVLQEAYQQLQRWAADRSTPLRLSVNVNISGKNFAHHNLMSRIDQILQTGNSCNLALKIEITESVLVENAMLATAILNQLRARNIQVCLDDFGTGYSSLSYLHQFPINTIKIDRSFISKLETDSENREIVKAIINLGLNLRLNVIAEGIETYDQLLFLKENGCKFGQGYYFSRPVNSQEIQKMLTRLTPE